MEELDGLTVVMMVMVAEEGTIPRDNGINQFTITVSDGEFSTSKTFSYRITDDTSDITVGWTTNDPLIL